MKNFLILILMTLTTAMMGQTSWDTLSTGIDGDWGQYPGTQEMVSTTYGSDLYVGYSYQKTWGSSVSKVTKYNGIFWSDLVVPLTPSSDFYITDLLVDSNSIYVLGRVRNGSFCLYEYSNSSWTYYEPTNFNGNIQSGSLYNGSLVLGGNFSDGDSLFDVMKFDNGQFYSMGITDSTLSVGDVEVINNELYVTFNESFATSPIIRFNNQTQTWDNVVNTLITYSSVTGGNSSSNDMGDDLELLSYNNTTYIVNKESEVFTLSNDTAYYFNTFGHSIAGVTDYNNVRVFVGDSTSFVGGYSLTSFDGFQFYNIYQTPKFVDMIDFGGYSICFSLDTMYNSIEYDRVYIMDTSDYGQIKGVTFIDKDGDCTFDNNENVLSNVVLVIDSNQITSSSNGNYGISLPVGTYDVDSVYFPHNNMKNISFNCSLPTSINVTQGNVTVRNLGATNNVSTDMLVDIVGYSGHRVRYGYTEGYRIQVSNTGSDTVSTTLTVNVPSTLSIDSLYPSGSVSGQTITYTLNDVVPNTNDYYNVYVVVDTSLNNIGDTVTWTASYSTISGEADMSDNSDTLSQEVKSSFDPNDKTVDYELIRSYNVDRLTYHIRFQNTGNDTAQKVVITDTLNTTLGRNIVMNSSSHNCRMDIQGDVIIWTFNNIMLPDSTTDEVNSHGYVNFSVNIPDHITVNDSMYNTANIYFDFNEAVITNTSVTKYAHDISVVESVWLEGDVIKVYPNPFRDNITIESSTDQSFSIYNLNGMRVFDGVVNSYDNQFDLSHLSGGMYVVVFENGETQKIVK